MKYCSECAKPLVRMIPEGDDRERYVCEYCNTVHYQNPKVVAGCILHHQGKILLCRRAIEPRSGYWSIPAGYLENGESALQGAAREALEEAHACACDLRLFGVFALPHLSQLYMVYSGELRDGYCKAGDETLEVGLFSPDTLPRQAMAFQLVEKILQDYWADHAAGRQRLYHADVISEPQAPLQLIEHEPAQY
ncbi:NUDIX hydrolase [Granulosicoccaceae sp. 1_MG-2023]|nr:NUDIX hydrolase [Granulosicoccaceae sp. 1_MG-2023]